MLFYQQAVCRKSAQMEKYHFKGVDYMKRAEDNVSTIQRTETKKR